MAIDTIVTRIVITLVSLYMLYRCYRFMVEKLQKEMRPAMEHAAQHANLVFDTEVKKAQMKKLSPLNPNRYVLGRKVKANQNKLRDRFGDDGDTD